MLPDHSRPKTALAALAVAGGLCSSPLHAQHSIDAEFNLVWSGYNDVAVPGNTGTRFSLTDDLEAGRSEAYRIRYGYRFGEKHWIGLLAAPLTVRSSGVLNKDIDFNGVRFAAGNAVDGTFRFDSYRLIYRYLLHQTDTVSFSLGGALKVRDAAIRLNSASASAEKANTGIVPLASFHFAWQLHDRMRLIIEGEALAAPQGRAEDVLVAMQHQLSPSLSLSAGYRILEGGADNDEVYTFSLFHQAVVGVGWRF